MTDALEDREAHASIGALPGVHPIKIVQYVRPLAELYYDHGNYAETDRLFREIIAIYDSPSATTTSRRLRRGNG